MRRSHPHPDGVGLGHRLRRGAAPSQVVQKGEAWLNSLTSGADSIGALALKHGSSIYVPSDCRRLGGPPLPPHGTPTATGSLERLNERLERLAFGGRPEGQNAPPLETYTVTPTEHGDVCRATPEYVRWFHRTYPAAGPEDRARIPTPRPTPEGVGGTSSRWRQNDIAP